MENGKNPVCRNIVGMLIVLVLLTPMLLLGDDAVIVQVDYSLDPIKTDKIKLVYELLKIEQSKESYIEDSLCTTYRWYLFENLTDSVQKVDVGFSLASGEQLVNPGNFISVTVDGKSRDSLIKQEAGIWKIEFQPQERKMVYVQQKSRWFHMHTQHHFSFPGILQIKHTPKFLHSLKLEYLWAGTPERIDIYYEFRREFNIEDEKWGDNRRIFIEPKGYYWLNNHTLVWRIENAEPKEDIAIETGYFAGYDTKNDIIKDWVGTCAEEVNCVDYCEPDFSDEAKEWYKGSSKLYTENDLNLWKDVDVEELREIPRRYRTYKAALEAYPELLRNVIYAVHGYPFKTEFWRSNFEKFAWYRPREDFSESDFNDIEQKNIAFILKYEKKIKEYLEDLEKQETSTTPKTEK